MLDETKETQDETSEDTRGTSEGDPETFTKESQTKAVSDALSTAGRDDKAMKAREVAVKVALDKAEKLQADIKADADKRAEQKYQDDLARAGDDPLAKNKVELDHSLKGARAELADTKTKLGKRDEELTDARKVAAESTKERNAREIASKYEVDFDTLILMDVSKEVMEAWAQKVSGKKPPAPQTIVADSGKTSGGSGGLTAEGIANMSPEERFARSKEIAAIEVPYIPLTT